MGNKFESEEGHCGGYIRMWFYQSWLSLSCLPNQCYPRVSHPPDMTSLYRKEMLTRNDHQQIIFSGVSKSSLNFHHRYQMCNLTHQEGICKCSNSKPYGRDSLWTGFTYRYCKLKRSGISDEPLAYFQGNKSVFSTLVQHPRQPLFCGI